MATPKLRRKPTIKRIYDAIFSTPSLPSTKAPGVKSRRSAFIALFILFFWPYLFVFMFGGLSDVNLQRLKHMDMEVMKSRMSKLLQRKDLVGYGPRYPRLVVLITGEDINAIKSAVESVFEHTDRNRILGVVTVIDKTMESNANKFFLESVDKGNTPHWHGRRYDIGGQKEHGEDSEEHGKKIHVLFNNMELGVSKSREIGALYAKKLAEKHEKAKLKLKEEEIILLLMHEQAMITTDRWLDPLTAALILPELSQQIYKTHLSNAVSFSPNVQIANNAIEDDQRKPNSVPSFGFSFEPTVYYPKESHGVSNGEIVTPALHGLITAMRLNTFLSLPARDTELTSHYAADLELALNLWLCADGIDILPHVTVMSKINDVREPKDLPNDLAVRIATAWMEDASLVHFKNSFLKQKQIPIETTEQMIDQARESITLPINLQTKCRSFEWYAKNMLHLFDEPKKKEKKGGIIKVETHKKTTLSEEKLELLKTAPFVDLTYVDVHDQVSHFAALDENGDEGYIHDATALRKNPPSFSFEKKQMCRKKNGNYKMLTKKVRVVKDQGEAKKVKLFCTIYTIEKNHGKLPMIRETFGQKCDGFMVASDKTDPALNTVNIPHEGPEAYENIWQKVRSIWSYIYDNYYEDYDWFHIGGDDLYLIVENLKYYLESDEIYTAASIGREEQGASKNAERALFLGRRFAEQGNLNRIFNSGGSGYTINKAALKLLVAETYPKCFPHRKTFAEDVMIAECFRNRGVYPYETKDDKGGERYMPFAPEHHLNYRIPANKESDWYAKYSLNIKEGYDHCAADAVAFHYISTDLMAQMHSTLYGYCE